MYIKLYSVRLELYKDDQAYAYLDIAASHITWKEFLVAIILANFKPKFNIRGALQEHVSCSL